MSRAVVLSAVRTPVGRYGGALSGERPDDLAALVIAEAVARAGVPAEEIEDVWFGAANQAGVPVTCAGSRSSFWRRWWMCTSTALLATSSFQP